ncbi:hypothetical protein BSKO_09442 [Bryopsis sp. KO-2023]|nr:hypothetical protein BSKO_09442 [Bryopsis sp. KO-2023]
MFGDRDVNDPKARADYRARQLAAMEGMGMIQREFWIQCDTCQKWRRTTAQVADEHSTQHWSCGDGGRVCSEVCDYCLYTECRCDLISDDGTAWCVSRGYTIPTGFTMHVKTPKEKNGGAGQPHVVYRAVCMRCAIESEPLDRRGKVESWLRAHNGCRAEWSRLDPRDFDFHVDDQLKAKLAEAGVDSGEHQVQVQANGQASLELQQHSVQRPTPSTGNASAATTSSQANVPYPRPANAYERIGSSEAGFVRPSSGVQVWGPAVQLRQGGVATYPQNVQYRGMWSGNPYGQPYGWVPLSDHPQFRNL